MTGLFINQGPIAQLVGTASLSGESGHNEELSAKLAMAVMKHLTTKGIAATKIQPSEPIALGDAPSITRGLRREPATACPSPAAKQGTF
jgi:hypothetical protein